MKKYLLYTLIILIALVGFFGVAPNVNAQAPSAATTTGLMAIPATPPVIGETNWYFESKTSTLGIENPNTINGPFKTEAECKAQTVGGLVSTGIIVRPCFQHTATTTATAPTTTTTSQQAATANSYFEAEINKNTCALTGIGNGTFWPGCFIQASYAIFYVVPGFLLWLSAYFFNVLIFATLNSTLLSGSFVPEAWAVTRDLSNLFFILILLYIAIKMILGLGGSDVKKMISKVIIIALLINFSMFFTKVVIDTSNILALVFYNKVQVSTTNSDGSQRQYENTANGEKDVAGGMVNAFNPTSLLTPDFFKKAGEQVVPGFFTVAGSAPPGILIGITIITGLLMLFAAYCFFVAGISFIGRLIELLILIIFSPFAFMSSTEPYLEKTSYIGWDDWLKRLLSVSFMAPIFMFFLYFIFMLVRSKIFDGMIDEKNTNFVGTILRIVIPALVILILLLKATDFAKKGSGKLGEMMMTGAKMVGGLALGGVALGGAFAARTALGGGGGYLANKAAVGAEKLGLGRTANKLRDFGQFAQKSSFDIRGIPGASKVLGMTGLATGAGLVGKAQQGGWAEMKKKQVEKRQKRAEELQKRGTSGKRKNKEEAEAKLNEATLPVKIDLEQAEKKIEKFRRDLNDAQKAGDADGIDTATTGLANAKQDKDALRAHAGLDRLETEVRNAQRELDTETGRIASEYAQQISGNWSKNLNSIFRLGAYSRAGADEASRKIRSGAKVIEEKK